MEFEKAAEAFRRKELELDFATITIAQCIETDPATYTGPGYFRQDASGKLEVKCYATTTPQMGIAAFNRQMRSSSGSLYGEEDHYRTSAIDHAGHEWEASPSLLGSSISLVTDASVMTLAPRRFIRRLGWRGAASRLRLEFFGQRERNWTALFGAHDIEYAEGQRLALSIERGTDEAVIVTASSAGSLPPALEMRLVEALQFALCLDLHVDISDSAGDGKRTAELRSAGPRPPRINPYPPLNTRSPGNTASVITLLQHYLRYAFAAPIADAWHPCSAHLAHARQASANSLEAWEVGLSVAVEGIANLIAAEPLSETIDYGTLRKELTAWLGERRYPESLVNRIGGMLGGLEMVRPKDRMMSLVDRGAVSKDDIAAWVRVRNTAVHTRQITSSKMISSRALSAAFLTLAVLISPAVGHDFQAGSITINHPWSRATPPVAPVAGGYLTLTNDGGMADRLVSISSPLSERAEIHESTVIDGVASMRPVQNGIEIGAGKTVELQPGGIHIMFLKPSRPLKEGERFAATLVFEQAGTIDVEFAVQNMGARPEFANEHDGHGEAVQ